MRPLAIALLLVLGGPAAAAEADVTVCFTPAQSCITPIVAAIDAAHASILVQAYHFTSPPILAALVAAHRRGIDVQIILDKANDRGGQAAGYTGASFVAHAGVPVWIDERPQIAHNKIMVIDGEVVVGGSYNLTRAADERNAENVTFTRSRAVAESFSENWQSRLAESRPYGAE